MVTSRVCKQPNLKARLSGASLPAVSQFHAIMQHDTTRTSPVFWLRKQGPSLTCSAETSQQNFVETLPTEMSVKIFGELDPGSLCSASRTCKLWHHVIEETEQLWKRQCLLVRTMCQKEVDSDRGHGLSWKVTLVRNYTRSCMKRDWLRGRYSHVSSSEELSGRRMAPLDAETWGEILQAELDR